MSDYQVRYTIQVFSEEAAKALERFKGQVASLDKTSKHIAEVKRQMTSLTQTCNALARKPLKFTITTNVADAVTDLNKIITLTGQACTNFERLQRLASSPLGQRAMQGQTGTATSKGGTGKQTKTTGGKSKNATAPIGGSTRLSEADQRTELNKLKSWMTSSKTEAKYGAVRDSYADKAAKREAARSPISQARAHNRAAFKRLFPNASLGEIDRWLRHNDVWSTYDGWRFEKPLPKNGPRARSYTAKPLYKPEEFQRGYNIPQYRTSGFYGASRTSSYHGGGGGGVRGAAVARPNNYGNIAYKNLGPTPMPSNGGMAIDMLKGMGIAYGISGIGSLISNIYSTSLEYENLTQSVRNILETHDDKGNFSGRFRSMIRTVRDVGKRTKYTVTEVADASKFLAMAGLGVEEIEAAIRPIANVALVGDTDLATTADLVTNILTAYNIPNGQMNWATDVMTNTFTRANVTLPEIAESMKYVAPIAMASHVPFEDIVAAIGVLGDAGIKGSQAGTSLRRIIQNFVAPRGKKRQDKWASALGVERFDAFGYLRPLSQVFKELGEKNLKAEDYFGLFDVTASQAAAALSQRYSKLGWLSAENAHSYGLAALLGKKRTETLKGLWAQVQSTIVDNGVTAFGGIEGQIRGLFLSALDYMGANDTPDNTAKGDRFRKNMREIANTAMEFIQVLKESTKWFLKFYNFMSPLIKAWMKYSLAIWPVTKALQAFASLGNSLLWLKTIPSRLGAITASMRGLTSATEANTAASVRNGLFGNVYTTYRGGAPKVGDTKYVGLGQRQMKYAFTSKTPMYDQYGNFVGYQTQGKWRKTGRSRWGTRWRWMKRNAGNTWGAVKQATSYGWNYLRHNPSGAGGAALRGIDRAGGGALMSGVGAYKAVDQAMSEDGSGWAAALYGAGAIASMFGPYGMIAGAVLMGTGAIVEYCHKVNLASEAVDRLREANKKWVVDSEGRIVNKEGSRQERYLDMLYSKEIDYGKVLEMNLQRIREKYNLLENPPMSEDTGSISIFNEEYQKMKDEWGSERQNYWHNKFNDLGKALGMEWDWDFGFSVGIPGDNAYIPEKARNGFAAALAEAMTGDSTSEYLSNWRNRISGTIVQGGDLATLYQEFQDAVPDYTARELVDKMPKTDKEWKRYLDNPELFWKLPLMQYMRHAIVNNRMKVGGEDWQAIVDAQDYWKQALASNGDIMGGYAGTMRFLSDSAGAGMIVNDYTDVNSWAKQQLGWNGVGFVDFKTGKPLEWDKLIENSKLLDETWNMAIARGLDKHMDNKDVAAYMNALDKYRRMLSAYIYQSFADEILRTGMNIWKPDSNFYQFIDPILKKENELWYLFDGKGGKSLYVPTPAPTGQNEEADPFLSGLSYIFNPNEEADPFLSGLPYIFNPNEEADPFLSGLSDIFNPNASPGLMGSDAPGLLAQRTLADFKPTFNISISAPLWNVEKMDVSKEVDTETLTNTITDLLSDVMTPEGLGRVPITFG